MSEKTYIVRQRVKGNRWEVVGQFAAGPSRCDAREGLRVFLFKVGIDYDCNPRKWSIR